MNWRSKHPTNETHFVGTRRPGSPILFIFAMVVVCIGWESNEVHSCQRANSNRALVASLHHRHISQLDCSLPFPEAK